MSTVVEPPTRRLGPLERAGGAVAIAAILFCLIALGAQLLNRSITDSGTHAVLSGSAASALVTVNEDGSASQRANAHLPQTYRIDSSTRTVSVGVTATAGGTVACQIVDHDGQVLRRATSTGAGTTAVCAVRLR